jgi:hypothetical protein
MGRPWRYFTVWSLELSSYRRGANGSFRAIADTSAASIALEFRICYNR